MIRANNFSVRSVSVRGMTDHLVRNDIIIRDTFDPKQSNIYFNSFIITLALVGKNMDILPLNLINLSDFEISEITNLINGSIFLQKIFKNKLIKDNPFYRNRLHFNDELLNLLHSNIKFSSPDIELLYSLQNYLFNFVHLIKFYKAAFLPLEVLNYLAKKTNTIFTQSDLVDCILKFYECDKNNFVYGMNITIRNNGFEV